MRDGELDHVDLAGLQGQQAHQVAHLYGFFHQRGHQPRSAHCDIYAPRIVEHPFILWIVHSAYGTADAEFALGQQRDHKVHLVIAGRRNDYVIFFKLGLLEDR